jgi:hypothetical protein
MESSEDFSIFENIGDLEYKNSSCSDTFIYDLIQDEQRIRNEVKSEMRQEFYNVYIKNELYYQKYVSQLSKMIEEKEKTEKSLVDILKDTTKLCKRLQEENITLKSNLKKQRVN